MRKRVQAFGLLAALVAVGTHAATLQVSPIGLDLALPKSAGSVQITNRGSEPVNLQFRLFAWTETEGRETLSPTDKAVVGPPAATLAPGQTYTVRVLRIAKAMPAQEETYRLLVDELPKPIDPRSVPAGLRIVTRTSLPVFFSPPRVIPTIEWKASCDAGVVTISARNTGRRHSRITDLALATVGKPTVSAGNLNEYLLAGSTLSIKLPPVAGPCPTTATLSGVTDAGSFKEAVSLSRG